MKTKTIIIYAVVISLCIALIFTVNITGNTTYKKSDAELGGINIAGTAEWEDYPGHRERNEPAKLYDGLTNYWTCSSDFNCSLTAYFEEPAEINEIHIHACNFKKDKYIPKSFAIDLNETDGFYTYFVETNNSYTTDYKLPFKEPKTVSGVRIKDLQGSSFYGVGDYDYPCIEEVEIYQVRENTPKSAPEDNNTAASGSNTTEKVAEPAKTTFWQRLKWLIFGE